MEKKRSDPSFFYVVFVKKETTVMTNWALSLNATNTWSEAVDTDSEVKSTQW